MGCPTSVVIGDNAMVSIYTHDPDTGAVSAAESAPSYWIRDENDGDVLSGTMDSGFRTGSYIKKIACTAANGFEVGKSYTIYIEATVDGDTGGIAFSFQLASPRNLATETTVIESG